MEAETPSGTGGQGGREVAWAVTYPASSSLQGRGVGVRDKWGKIMQHSAL